MCLSGENYSRILHEGSGAESSAILRFRWASTLYSSNVVLFFFMLIDFFNYV
jgi:hypothetical protein